MERKTCAKSKLSQGAVGQRTQHWASHPSPPYPLPSVNLLFPEGTLNSSVSHKNPQASWVGYSWCQKLLSVIPAAHPNIRPHPQTIALKHPAPLRLEEIFIYNFTDEKTVAFFPEGLSILMSPFPLLPLRRLEGWAGWEVFWGEIVVKEMGFWCDLIIYKEYSVNVQI